MKPTKRHVAGDRKLELKNMNLMTTTHLIDEFMKRNVCCNQLRPGAVDTVDTEHTVTRHSMSSCLNMSWIHG